MGKKKRQQPQQSFQQMVSDATLAKFKPYIDSQIQGVAAALAQQQRQQMENVFLRLTVLEQVVEEKLDISKDELAGRVADVEDQAQGFLPVKTVEEGDRVRMEIRTKAADQDEYQGESRLMVDNVGSGQTLGPEIEKPVVGMATGEVKEIKFGKDQSMTAQVTINRVSRAPKQEESDDSNEG